MSNVDRLRDAHIIDPTKPLSQEQTDAIESLTEAEVDGLISSQAKLYPGITEEDDIFDWPGIPQGSKQR